MNATGAAALLAVLVACGPPPAPPADVVMTPVHRLADPDPRRRIEELLAQRKAAYDQADLQIDTSDRDLDDIVAQIADFLAHRGRP